MSETIFISGIDTDAGKSYVTGWLAKQYMDQGLSVITEKPIQTGNHEFSEDIEVHRRIMGIGMQPVDIEHTTAPIIFSYPASPHLAAKIDGQSVDLSLIDDATKRLESLYDIVLIEGAGGLMVPLTDDMLTIEYPLTRHLPVVLVTNGRLGSINHTILSLEALQTRGMQLHSLLYNTHFDNDKVIATDTREFLKKYLAKNWPGVEMILVPSLDI
ncbi:MAG: dethiobiotin synthase [Muribaculaceae bacterium]|nr:dethiobiotin synthase [Muribaculaceae bacterium]